MIRASILVGLLFGASGAAAALEVTNVRVWPAPDHTRVVFDTDGPVDHSVFVLKKPERVVVDLRGTRLMTKIARPSRSDPILSRVRSAPRNELDLRVVFDMKREVRPRSFILKPSKKYGYRLVVDLYHKPAAANGRARVVKRLEPSANHRLREVVVAIDPGHGGEDPGAVGASGTYEKDVVLAVAKKIRDLLRRGRGIRPVLVRQGDYYVGLRKRMEIARAHRADLYVSIHADAFRDKRVSGTSVYILSRRGASSEAARWLAEQENATDLVGGVSLDDKDEVLASVLLDLSQTATISASTEVASKVLRHLKAVGKVHKPNVERAGFMVLKSPDVPSILVEIAFITNPSDERRLKHAHHQRRVAQAIVGGIRTYFQKNPPPGTLLASRKHVISKGDTLSKIAARYRVSLASLRKVNNLSGNRIREGDVLRIPAPVGRDS